MAGAGLPHQARGVALNVGGGLGETRAGATRERVLEPLTGHPRAARQGHLDAVNGQDALAPDALHVARNIGVDDRVPQVAVLRFGAGQLEQRLLAASPD
jgi:hypothetical protein